MAENASQGGSRSKGVRNDTVVRLAALGGGAAALAGVAGYWIAGALQCGLSSTPLQPVECPLSDTLILVYLTLLTCGAVVVAVVSVRGGPGRLSSVASAILVVGGLGFPARGVFGWVLVPSGGLDPRLLAGAFIVAGGLIGFLASAWQRRPLGEKDGPYNRLALGAAFVALATEFTWFQTCYSFGSGPSQHYGETVSCFPQQALPESAAIALLAAAVVIALPIAVRRLTAVSAGCAIVALVAAMYGWTPAILGGETEVSTALILIGSGALISLTGSIPSLWTIYLAPRYGPFWQPTSWIEH